MFNTDDIHVKYLDDEDEEVKIDNQNDYEFANQVKFINTIYMYKLEFSSREIDILPIYFRIVSEKNKIKNI